MTQFFQGSLPNTHKKRKWKIVAIALGRRSGRKVRLREIKEWPDFFAIDPKEGSRKATSIYRMNECVLGRDIYQQDFDKLLDFLSLRVSKKQVAAKISKCYQLLRFLSIELIKMSENTLLIFFCSLSLNTFLWFWGNNFLSLWICQG